MTDLPCSPIAYKIERRGKGFPTPTAPNQVEPVRGARIMADEGQYIKSDAIFKAPSYVDAEVWKL